MLMEEEREICVFKATLLNLKSVNFCFPEVAIVTYRSFI